MSQQLQRVQAKIDGWKQLPLPQQCSILQTVLQDMNPLQRACLLQHLVKLCPHVVDSCSDAAVRLQAETQFTPPTRSQVSSDSTSLSSDSASSLHQRALSFLKDMHAETASCPQYVPSLHFCSQTQPQNIAAWIRQSRDLWPSIPHTVARGEALHRLYHHPQLTFLTHADFFRYTAGCQLGSAATVGFEMDMYELVCVRKLERLLLLPSGHHRRLRGMSKTLKEVFRSESVAREWKL